MGIIKRIAINVLIVTTTYVMWDAINTGVEKIKETKKSKEKK